VLAAAGTITTLGCHDATLGPVQTVDGSWSGVANGYSLAFTLSQSDTLVSGTSSISSVGGSFGGTAVGSFKYPKLSLIIHVDGFEDAKYDGTMSTSEAKIFGVLNGSGLSNVEVDVRKK
jgi:hypothetical protein